MKKEYAMLLTLGHNASAIAVETRSGEPIGYEEERLTRIKSDSSFPHKAIIEIGKHIDLSQVKTFFVSSWFNGFDMNHESKYWNYGLFRQLCPNAVYAEANGLTHHDMHAWSALAFTEEFMAVDTRWHTLVIDGFGTNEEVMSLYRINEDNVPELIERQQGYEHSMGLMFQYAAESQGMDGINDVYKYLGYRARVDKDRLDYVRICAESFMKDYEYENIENVEMKYPINLERLMEVKQKRFINAFRKMKFTREEMGWFLQFVLEKYVFDIISKHKITNLMVAGGCFYNVRLNGRIAKYMDRFSVMPLAGDQGAAIGAYREYAGKGRFRFGDLCWGTRPDTITPMDQLGMTNFQVFKQKEFPYVIKEIADKLNNGEIVNIMRGEMEFGPRALCKTTTLAPPTMKHVEAINDLNDRNTVMPMAPVMTHGASRRLFDKKILTSVIGTDRFMVCAHEFQHGKGEEVSGAALKDGEAYTGRPQIVDVMTDATMVALLEMVNYECLINTSLNLHGDPIIFDIAGLRRVHATWLTRHTLKQPAFSTYCFV